MSSRIRLWGGLIATALVLSVGMGAAYWWVNGQERLPREIERKVNFFVYLPEEGSGYEVDRESFHHDQATGVLSFNVSSSPGKFAITQQATPETFQDIPNFYSQLLNKLRQFEILQTRIGTVTLTRPEELKGLQTAVANPPGTLLFVRPEKNLSSSEWKSFFDSLEVIK